MNFLPASPNKMSYSTVCCSSSSSNTSSTSAPEIINKNNKNKPKAYRGQHARSQCSAVAEGNSSFPFKTLPSSALLPSSSVLLPQQKQQRSRVFWLPALLLPIIILCPSGGMAQSELTNNLMNLKVYMLMSKCKESFPIGKCYSFAPGLTIPGADYRRDYGLSRRQCADVCKSLFAPQRFQQKWYIHFHFQPTLVAWPSSGGDQVANAH
jgi:hypothetical protein